MPSTPAIGGQITQKISKISAPVKISLCYPCFQPEMVEGDAQGASFAKIASQIPEGDLEFDDELGVLMLNGFDFTLCSATCTSAPLRFRRRSFQFLQALADSKGRVDEGSDLVCKNWRGFSFRLHSACRSSIGPTSQRGASKL